MFDHLIDRTIKPFTADLLSSLLTWITDSYSIRVHLRLPRGLRNATIRAALRREENAEAGA
jgi:hypothetical protein